MFSIHLKGFRDPKNPELVKLNMIIYKSGEIRVQRVLYITGPYKEWDSKSRRFKGKSPELSAKNNLLQRERLRYLKVAERWEYEDKNWLPAELAHYYDKSRQVRDQYTTVAEMIDKIVDKFKARERFKNDRVMTSESTALGYIYLKSSLDKFTRSKYHREFAKYLFRDMDEKFLCAFAVYEQQRGAVNGNHGGIHRKLKLLHAVCTTAKRERVFGVNLAAFLPVKGKLRTTYYTPKAVSHETISRIEEVDRSTLKKREQLYLDLFLFSYYAAGMSPVDICLLTKGSLRENAIVYERVKLDKLARVILIDKAATLIEKYRTESCMDYVFPVIRKCRMTQLQTCRRVKNVGVAVNATLRKVCEELGIEERVYWSSARASFISRMIDEGYHPLQVAEQVGNSPQAIYRYYYAITNKEEMRKGMNRVFSI